LLKIFFKKPLITPHLTTFFPIYNLKLCAYLNLRLNPEKKKELKAYKPIADFADISNLERSVNIGFLYNQTLTETKLLLKVL